jgi:hypothetical protein
VCAWCVPVAGARADAAGLEAQMVRVLQPYLAVQSSVASDSNEGVRRQATLIAKEAKKLGTRAAAENAERFRALATDVIRAADELAKATSLERSSAAFKKLSQPLVQWARVSGPADVLVVTCPVLKGSWL